MLVQGLNSFFQAKAVRDYQSGGKPALCRSLVTLLVLFLGLLGCVSITFFFGGEWLLGLIEPKFSPLSDIVFWLSIHTLLVSVTIVAGNGMAALGKSMGFVWGEAAYLVATLTGSMILIPSYGLKGAAWALVAGGVAGVVVQTITLGVLLSKTSSNAQVAENKFADHLEF